MVCHKGRWLEGRLQREALGVTIDALESDLDSARGDARTFEEAVKRHAFPHPGADQGPAYVVGYAFELSLIHICARSKISNNSLGLPSSL